jgi:alanine racemase
MNTSAFLHRIRNRLVRQTPLVEVSISRENLLHNLHTYQERFPGISFVPVLKSNAYGHDVGTIAHLLDDESITFFMLDSAFEARKLRASGIHSRLLVMGYVRPEEIVGNSIANTDYVIVDIEQLREISRTAKHGVRLHLKIDTGMHRHGILPEKLKETAALIKGNKHLKVVGICSHFADADNEDTTFTKKQLDRWSAALDIALPLFPTIEYRHLAATKGVAHCKDARTNVARLGIGLYGIDTSTKRDSSFKPVLEMRSLITSLRTIASGESIGYNATHTVIKPTTIATVPVGYFEGVDRRLSTKGCMIVRDVECPIVGRVSMNMTNLDVSEVAGVTVGDPVVVISRDSEANNSILHIAEQTSSSEYRETPYVVMVHVAQHLRRIVE